MAVGIALAIAKGQALPLDMLDLDVFSRRNDFTLAAARGGLALRLGVADDAREVPAASIDEPVRDLV